MPPDAQANSLEDALLHAFSLESMTRMLRRQFGIILAQEMDVHRGAKYIFGDLVQLASQDGWLDDLIRGALVENPGNPRLKAVALALNIFAPQTPSTPPAGSVQLAALDQSKLEKTARERGVMIKFEEYSTKLTAFARRMCLIEVPSGQAQGTGWLVAPDLVLTNYHVMEDVHKNRVAAAEVTCRFDYFEQGAGGIACGLAANWLKDWSPYSKGDLAAGLPDPTIDEVDYALIQLARPVGDELAAGVKRGWMELKAAPPAVIAEDIVMIPQFPDGRSLELSFGKALAFNNTGTRLRYDANTEPGSSGSPVMTMAVQPFGLHHAAGLGKSLYNQCVPLRVIIQRMTRQNIPAFWQA